MGFWLWKYFLAKRLTAQLVTGTDVFNLPKQGIISNLMLELQALSGTGNVDIYLADAIQKIEVIGNGSAVIQSLTGLQVQASAAYDDSRYPPDKEYSPSGTCYGYFDIRFGRYPGDQKYALDCSKWDSLELKITYDLKAGGTIGDTGYVTSVGYFTIYGLFSPDGAGLAPVGYLKKAQKKVYTTAAGGTEDLALPDDYPFRRLLLGMTTHASIVYNAWDYITININDGARKPIDNMRGADLMIFDLGLRGNPVWMHSKTYYIGTSYSLIHPPLNWIKGANPVGMSGTLSVTIDVDIAKVNIAMSAAGMCPIDIWGYAPGRSLAIDLERWSGGKDGVEAMMDAWGYDQSADIHLLHTQEVASLASQVVLEQYATPPV